LQDTPVRSGGDCNLLGNSCSAVMFELEATNSRCTDKVFGDAELVHSRCFGERLCRFCVSEVDAEVGQALS